MSRLPLILLVLLLGGLSLFAVLQADWGDFERGPVGKERVLWQIAQDGNPDLIARTDQPLHLRWLAPLAGDDPRDMIAARRLLRGVFVPLLSLLVWILLRRRTGPWPALAGAAAVGLSGPVLLLSASVEPGAAAAAFGLLALVVLDGRSRPLPLAVGAALLAPVAWLVPELGWALALLLVGFLIAGGHRRGGLLVAVTFLLALYASGRAVDAERLVPRVSGIELYAGHRTEHRGGDPTRGDTDAERWWGSQEYRAHASRDEATRLDEDQVSGYWGKRAVGDALRAPHREILRTAVKTLGTLQSSPLPRGVSATYLAERAEGSGVTVGLWLGRVLLALGAAGLWIARRRLGPALVAGLLGGVLAVWATTLQGDARAITVCLLAGGFGLWVEAVVRRPKAAAGFGALALGLLLGLPLLGAVPGLARGPQDDFQLGILYQREGRGTAAIREFDRALRADEDLPFPRMALGDLLAGDQVLDQAIVEYERVRDTYPDLLRPPLRLSLLYQQQEQWREMIVVNEALVRLDPTSAEYRNNLGTAFLGAGLFQRAEDAFLQALEIDPGYAIARTNLEGMQGAGLAATEQQADTLSPEAVMVQLRERRYGDARATLDALFAERGDEDPQLRFLEATLFLEMGEGDRAVARFEELRPLFGENPFFLHNLAASYARTGRPLDALALWAGLARGNPSNQVFQQSLQQVQRDLQAVAARALAAGDPEAAVIVWEALVEHVPDRGDYADSLAAARARRP